MPLTNTPQQLLLIKQLFDDACILADRLDDLSLTKSLILLDLSVEQMLNQIIRDCSLNTNSSSAFGRRDIGWQKIWDAADQAMKSRGFGLIHHRDLSSLHESRNMVQHNATIPTQIEVQRYLEPAREMINSVFKDIYNKDFCNFALWDLIENKSLRELLKDSEDALNNLQITICLVGCNIAYSHIISAIRSHTKFRNFQSSQFLDRFTSPRLPAGTSLGTERMVREATHQLNEAIRKGVAEFRGEILREIEFLENEVVAIGIGLSIIDTRRFQRIGNSVLIDSPYNGDPVIRVKNSDVTEPDARFMLSYLSKLIHLIDESYSEVLDTIEIKKTLREMSIWKKMVDDNINP